jgi:hypothetical protein
MREILHLSLQCLGKWTIFNISFKERPIYSPNQTQFVGEEQHMKSQKFIDNVKISKSLLKKPRDRVIREMLNVNFTAWSMNCRRWILGLLLSQKKLDFVKFKMLISLHMGNYQIENIATDEGSTGRLQQRRHCTSWSGTFRSRENSWKTKESGGSSNAKGRLRWIMSNLKWFLTWVWLNVKGLELFTNEKQILFHRTIFLIRSTNQKWP